MIDKDLLIETLKQRADSATYPFAAGNAFASLASELERGEYDVDEPKGEPAAGEPPVQAAATALQNGTDAESVLRELRVPDVPDVMDELGTRSQWLHARADATEKARLLLSESVNAALNPPRTEEPANARTRAYLEGKL